MQKVLLSSFMIAVVVASGTVFGQQDSFAELLMEADTKQFFELFPRGVLFEKVVKQTRRVSPILLDELNRKLPPDRRSELKVRLASRQANAAVALLRINQPEKTWLLLKHSPDPGARSFLIHRLGPFGVDAKNIIEHLDVEPDISILRALILSLGEFDERALLLEDRDKVLPKLQTIYRTTVDPGLHSATEWLIRQWNQEEWLKEVNEVWANDRELVSRQWYVNRQGQTMVEFTGPIEFMMGSPTTEVGRMVDEAQHNHRINQSFAIASKEVTVAQFLRFREYHSYVEYHCPNDTCPVNNVSWYEAAAYCNWLNEQEGIPKDQWCYEPNKDGEYKSGMKMATDHLTRTGYRLPTEAEWEYACRAGADTRYPFGESEELLLKHACGRDGIYAGNCFPAGSLKPNDFGLFDMNGNVKEWCQDLYGPYVNGTKNGDTAGSDQDITIDEKRRHVLRGGSFVDNWAPLRCSCRDYFSPRYCDAKIGFRLARTISVQAENTGK